MIDIAAIDTQLSQQGQFCLLDWLLADNYLPYEDYEKWRYGELKDLDDAFLFDRKALHQLINESRNHCHDLGLINESQSYYAWGGDHQILSITTENSEYNRELGQVWLRPQDRPQLDLFLDNSAQIAENAVLDALAGRQFEPAQTALQNLAELNSECAKLGGYQDLINYGLHAQTNPLINEEMLDAEQQGLQQEVLPLAHDVLGVHARDYLSFAWRRLANSMQNTPFNPDQPQLHASLALLTIPDYPATVKCLTAESSLFQQPVLMERLITSYNALHQHENELIQWCLLVELDADFTERALEKFRSQRVFALWQDFWEINDDWPTSQFPAYILIRQPGLLHHLDNFPTLRLSSSRTTIRLLRKRLAGEDEIIARKELQALSPMLLSVYLERL